MDHLLLHCGKAYRLWNLVFRSFGISWVLPKLVADTLFGWWNWFWKHLSSIWNLAWLCLMWCLWRERNWRTFEDMDSSDDQLLASFSGSLFDWSRAWGLTSSVLSLCSLAPFLVISIFSFCFLSSFSLYFFFRLIFFLHEVVFFFNIHLYYLSKNNNNLGQGDLNPRCFHWKHQCVPTSCYKL